jgi:hypothetical protein
MSYGTTCMRKSVLTTVKESYLRSGTIKWTRTGLASRTDGNDDAYIDPMLGGIGMTVDMASKYIKMGKEGEKPADKLRSRVYILASPWCSASYAGAYTRGVSDMNKYH